MRLIEIFAEEVHIGGGCRDARPGGELPPKWCRQTVEVERSGSKLQLICLACLSWQSADANGGEDVTAQ